MKANLELIYSISIVKLADWSQDGALHAAYRRLKRCLSFWASWDVVIPVTDIRLVEKDQSLPRQWIRSCLPLGMGNTTPKCVHWIPVIRALG